MSRPFVCLGDRTDHGGTVIEADMTWTTHGRPVALQGHKVVCRKCKGTFPIVTGAEDMTSFGMAAARHGDKTACGAMLIAGQALSTWSSKADSGGGGGSSPTETAAAQVGQAAPAVVAPQTSTLCLECLAAAAGRAATLVMRGG